MIRAFRVCITFLSAASCLLLTSCSSVTVSTPDIQETAETWTFVSMPDFINVDTTYPQPGWEDTLDYVLKAVKAENPDFVLVAGDLVMGRWWREEKIEKYAAIYYPDWIKRMNAHGLKFYTAIGDHDIGDNPWPANRAKLVLYRNVLHKNVHVRGLTVSECPRRKPPISGSSRIKSIPFGRLANSLREEEEIARLYNVDAQFSREAGMCV